MTVDEGARPSRDALWLGLAGAALSVGILLSPTLPCIDWPQHLALAEQLRRLWADDPAAHAIYRTNVATHNGGVHFVVAALGSVLGTGLAGRLVLAAYPLVFLGAARAFFRALGVPGERALLLVPAVLGFSFGWGFANFCFASALALLVAATFVRSLGEHGGTARVALPMLSLVLGVVHVMGMLLGATLVLALGVEALVRRKASVSRIVLGGALLFPGVAFDGWVTFAHLAEKADSYTSFPEGFASAGLFQKLLFLGTHVAGLWGTYVDTGLAWALLAALAVGGAVGVRRAGLGWAAPLVVGLVAYLAIPHVWMSTHLVYQRAAVVVVVGLVALPRALPAWTESVGRGLAAATVLAAFVHLAWFAHETTDARAVLAHVPKGARVTTVVDSPRTRAVRMPVLAHTAAHAVLLGAKDDSFSFGRFMSLPIVYKPYATEPSPSPSWEQAAGPYLAASRLARKFPVVVARLREGEGEAAGRARLFGDREVAMLGAAGQWVVWDSGEPAAR